MDFFPDSRLWSPKYFQTKSTPPPSHGNLEHVSGIFFSHENNNIFYRITQNFFGLLKRFGPVLGNFWLLSGNFSFSIKIISFVYQIIPIFLIGSTCLEISSMCPESWIIHKDCAIFYPVPQKFADCSKFPWCTRKFRICVLKFPDWYTFLWWVRKFPACVWKRWSSKNIKFVFYHMTQQISRLLKVSSMCLEVFSMCLEISRFLKICGTCPEIFSLCLDFFFNFLMKMSFKFLLPGFFLFLQPMVYLEEVP